MEIWLSSIVNHYTLIGVAGLTVTCICHIALPFAFPNLLPGILTAPWLYQLIPFCGVWLFFLVVGLVKRRAASVKRDKTDC